MLSLKFLKAGLNLRKMRNNGYTENTRSSFLQVLCLDFVRIMGPLSDVLAGEYCVTLHVKHATWHKCNMAQTNLTGHLQELHRSPNRIQYPTHKL